jgi:hypothetical protein
MTSNVPILLGMPTVILERRAEEGKDDPPKSG